MEILLKGKQIHLRLLTKHDAADIAKYAHDRSVNRFTLVPYPYAVKDADEFIMNCRKGYRKGTAYNLGIEYKTTGEIIGVIGINGLASIHKRAETGYWLAKKYRGLGITSEALRLSTRFCFNKLKLQRVHAYVDPKNISSIKVLEKCGYTREGLLRKFWRQRNRQNDVYIYSILKGEKLK